MIKIITKIDSVENNPEALTFSCKWEELSEMTEGEEAVAGLILARIQSAFDDISNSTLINGGSVKRTFKKGEDEKE